MVAYAAAELPSKCFLLPKRFKAAVVGHWLSMLDRRLRLWPMALLLLATMVTAGCVGQAPTPAPLPTLEPAPEYIKVGFSISLSGSYARKGECSLQAIELWADWVNSQGGIYIREYGRKIPVKLVYYDDESNREAAARIYERLCVEDRVHVALCPCSSLLTYAVAPILEKYRVTGLVYSTASTRMFQRGLKYIVQVVSPSSRYLADIIRMLAESPDVREKPETVAFVFADAEFPRSCAEAAKEAAESHGMRVVLFEEYSRESADLTPVLSKVKALSPDVLLGGGYLPDALLMVRQMKELDVHVKLVGLLVAPPMPDFIEGLGRDALYIVGPTQWECGAAYSPEFGPTAEWFIEEVKRRYGIEPSYHHAEAFAACLILQKAIEEAGSLDSDRIREACSRLELTTFFGKFKIDPETGLQVAHSVVVIQIQEVDGELKRVIVWPPEVAQAKLIYPMPP